MKDGPGNVIEQYNYDECAACGECLTHCPYMDFSLAQAAREMRRMRKGRGSVVVRKCVGCWTCDTYCPNGNRPYTLIRSLWYMRYNKKGLPERARYMMPHSEPNFRSQIQYSAKEKKIVDRLAGPPDSEVVLYTGCNSLMFPRIFESEIFDGLSPFGSLDYCCGEMYYRMGLFDDAEKTGLALKKTLDRFKIKKMVFICAACMNIISNVLPREFGIEFDFEKQFLATWLLERIESGTLKLKKKMNKIVCVQDSCHAKMMAPDIHESPRKLLEALGARIEEAQYNRNDSRCCGLAAGVGRYSMYDMISAGLQRTNDMRKAETDMAVTYCNGCQLTLGMMGLMNPLAPKMMPLVQLVQEAAGEKPDYGILQKRALQMAANILINAGPVLMSPKHFKM